MIADQLIKIAEGLYEQWPASAVIVSDAAQMLRDQKGWKRCLDELPESDLTVLAYASGSDEPIWLAYHDGENWIGVEGGELAGRDIPTHWMDFPEPPGKKAPKSTKTPSQDSAIRESTNSWKCRQCGCDNAHACKGGCGWVEKNLCTRCVAFADNFTHEEVEVIQFALSYLNQCARFSSRSKNHILSFLKKRFAGHLAGVKSK